MSYHFGVAVDEARLRTAGFSPAPPQRRRMLGALAAASILALVACASTVHTIATELDLNTAQLRAALENPVPGYMEVYADLQDAKVVAQFRLSRDQRTRRKLQRLVDRIVANSHKKQMRLTVRLLDDDTINAFVTGSGYVYVFQGLLDQAESEDEIATILGHEIAHIDAGHIHRRQRSLIWTSLALLAADALTKGDTADEIVQTAAALIPPAFSRKHEREADILGSIYAKRAGHDPRRVNDFFRRSWAAEERTRAALERRLRAADQAYRRANSSYQSAFTSYSANQNTYTYAAATLAHRNLQTAAVAYEQVKVSYVSFVRRSSPLFRSHPVDQERIQTVAEVSEYAAGRRPLQSFSSRSPIFVTISVLRDVENRERALPFFTRSRELLGRGDTEGALLELENAVGADPKYAEAWAAIGNLYMDRRQGIPAARAFERARAAEPMEFHEEWKLGWAYAATGRKRLAVQEFEHAVRRDGKNASLRIALGDSYRRIDQPKKALKEYREARKLENDPAQLARLSAKMASCYEALGKDGEAVRSLKEALGYDPGCRDCAEQLRALTRSP